MPTPNEPGSAPSPDDLKRLFKQSGLLKDNLDTIRTQTSQLEFQRTLAGEINKAFKQVYDTQDKLKYLTISELGTQEHIKEVSKDINKTKKSLIQFDHQLNYPSAFSL